jgi:hypothetical protein
MKMMIMLVVLVLTGCAEGSQSDTPPKPVDPATLGMGAFAPGPDGNISPEGKAWVKSYCKYKAAQQQGGQDSQRKWFETCMIKRGINPPF